jgi:hypothetical protein
VSFIRIGVHRRLRPWTHLAKSDLQFPHFRLFCDRPPNHAYVRRLFIFRYDTIARNKVGNYLRSDYRNDCGVARLVSIAAGAFRNSSTQRISRSDTVRNQEYATELIFRTSRPNGCLAPNLQKTEETKDFG